jgi:hypothetical protein
LTLTRFVLGNTGGEPARLPELVLAKVEFKKAENKLHKYNITMLYHTSVISLFIMSTT